MELSSKSGVYEDYEVFTAMTQFLSFSLTLHFFLYLEVYYIYNI